MVVMSPARSAIPVREPLAPTRFQLTKEQISAAMALADVRPGRRSVLPEPKAAADPAGLLRGTGLLSAGSLSLTAEAVAMLRVVAEPARVLSLTYNRAGSENWAQTAILRGFDSCFVAESANADKFDLALFPSAAQVAVLIDEHLNLTDLYSQAGKAPLQVSLPGFVAWLAVADALQTAYLEARRSRKAEQVPMLTAQLLEAQLREGLTHKDTRWAVTSAQPVSPINLGLASGRMAAGVSELQAAGVLTPGKPGYTFTEMALAMASALGQLIASAGLTVADTKQDGGVGVSHFTLFRAATAISLANWKTVTQDDAQVEIAELSAAQALLFLRSVLDPSAAASIEMPKARPTTSPERVTLGSRPARPTTLPE
jgi:hypothetical protein